VINTPLQVDNQPGLLLRTVDHCVNTGCEGIHARETDAITVRGKWYCQKQKMGIHFDDVLVHDVCWISWRNLGYPFAKYIGIGIAHVDV
jgi:hypothetical protein